MKRLRIWINGFSLMQQFLAIAMLITVLIVTSFFSNFNSNIDNFVNQQMYSYIHRSQTTFLASRENYEGFDDTNVLHFVYSRRSHTYLNDVRGYDDLLSRIDPDTGEELKDLSLNYEEEEILYSILSFEEGSYALISFLNNSYREEFKSALIEVVLNVSVYLLFILFFFFLIWVLSLIRPLNQIRNYINKIKNGENASLNIRRHDEIGEVAEALTTMHEELEQQTRIREEMIQNISHDLKTPIATIKSYSESIKDGVYPYDTLEKSVDVISEHADRLEKKVLSLITLNKMGYLTDNSEEGDRLYMPDVITKAILSCQVLRNDVTIEPDIDEKVYFHGEEEPWRVVVENLLDNALRYAKSLVKITLKDDLLEIYNDGELMSKERIDKLFKPYEKGTGGKFGLGLSIVKKVVETYGYNVTGENMNDGVIFRVYRLRRSKRSAKKSDKV